MKENKTNLRNIFPEAYLPEMNTWAINKEYEDIAYYKGDSVLTIGFLNNDNTNIYASIHWFSEDNRSRHRDDYMIATDKEVISRFREFIRSKNQFAPTTIIWHKGTKYRLTDNISLDKTTFLIGGISASEFRSKMIPVYVNGDINIKI